MGGDTVPKGAMKNGRYVKFINGKTPESLEAEGQTAQQQHAARVAEARKAGVLDPHFDDGGNLVGGVNLHTGELMTANANGQLESDGHENPERVKELLAKEAHPPPTRPRRVRPRAGRMARRVPERATVLCHFRGDTWNPAA